MYVEYTAGQEEIRKRSVLTENAEKQWIVIKQQYMLGFIPYVLYNKLSGWIKFDSECSEGVDSSS